MIDVVSIKFKNRGKSYFFDPGKLDIKTQEAKLNQRTMQMAAGYMSELYANAKIVDNRYLFF